MSTSICWSRNLNYKESLTIKHALSLKQDDPLAEKLYVEVSKEIESFRKRNSIKRGTNHDRELNSNEK